MPSIPPTEEEAARMKKAYEEKQAAKAERVRLYREEQERLAEAVILHVTEEVPDLEEIEIEAPPVPVPVSETEPEPEVEVDPMEEYRNLSYVNLRSAAKKLGIKAVGKKSVLLGKIEKAISS
tara:strand:+ start:5853 stop:6218 length:366 start_codon:yes stop_codon:yes gene_type:complete